MRGQSWEENQIYLAVASDLFLITSHTCHMPHVLEMVWRFSKDELLLQTSLGPNYYPCFVALKAWTPRRKQVYFLNQKKESYQEFSSGTSGQHHQVRHILCFSGLQDLVVFSTNAKVALILNSVILGLACFFPPLRPLGHHHSNCSSWLNTPCARRVLCIGDTE